MAHDEDLAHRIRAALADEDGVSETAMFGGLAFMLHGNIAVAISSKGDLMVRLGADGAQAALGSPHTRPMAMRGRTMKGWVLVDAQALDGDAALAEWVGRGVGYAGTLAPKG